MVPESGQNNTVFDRDFTQGYSFRRSFHRRLLQCVMMTRQLCNRAFLDGHPEGLGEIPVKIPVPPGVIPVGDPGGPEKEKKTMGPGRWVLWTTD